jgi:hypothetical protein
MADKGRQGGQGRQRFFSPSDHQALLSDRDNGEALLLIKMKSFMTELFGNILDFEAVLRMWTARLPLVIGSLAYNRGRRQLRMPMAAEQMVP